MKVLILTNLPTPYRIDFFTELGKYCELTVVIEAHRSKDLRFNWNDDSYENFQLIYLNKGLLNEKKINWSILTYLDRKKYDKIIITCYHTFTSMIAIIYLKLKHIPYCFETDGGIINFKESKFYKRVKTFFISNASLYFSSSKGSDEYLKYYGAIKEKIYRYPFTSLKKENILSTPLSLFEKKKVKSSLGIKEEQMVLAVGQFIYRKGFDILLEAVQYLNKNIGIYIIGGEPTEDYLRIQRELNLTNIHFQNFKKEKELTSFLKAADIFVHPTREDIWGLVINESMAYALPVITTDRCVAGLELIQDKNCIVEINNARVLARAINRILENENIANELGRCNLEKISNYTIESMAKVHFDILSNNSSFI